MILAGEKAMWMGRSWQAGAALSLASFSLGGCWYSNGLLIAQADSAQPVESGEYWHRPEVGEASSVTIEQIPGGGYLYREDGRVSSLFVVQVSENWYALQLSGDGKKALYSAAHLGADRIDFYDPDCDDELGALEYVSRENSDCHFTGIEGLRAATELIASRVADGTISEPSTWARLEKPAEE